MSPRLLYLLKLFMFAVIVYGLHYVAIIFYLYWTLPWFDILMHFLGGALIGYGVYVGGRLFNTRLSFVQLITLVMIVGIGWEIFEYAVGLAPLSEYRDTLLDLVLDFSGAAVAYYVTRLCA